MIVISNIEWRLYLVISNGSGSGEAREEGEEAVPHHLQLFNKVKGQK
jgi:hypothetical protein